RDADLLDDVLADLGDEEPAVFRIPAEALRISEAVQVDLAERARFADERIRRRYAVLAVGAGGSVRLAVGPGGSVRLQPDRRLERIDAQHLAERRAEVLRGVERIAAA